MFLPDEAVKEFQEIYRKKVGNNISFEKARIEAESFLRFFDLITQPTNKNKDDTHKNKKLR